MRSDEDRLAEIESGDGPDPIASVSGELARVAVAAMDVEGAEASLRDAVASARRTGHTWQSIGDVLGMTRQGALKRFRVA